MPGWVELPILIVGIMFCGTAVIMGVGELVAFSMRRAKRNRLLKDTGKAKRKFWRNENG